MEHGRKSVARKRPDNNIPGINTYQNILLLYASECFE